MDKIVNRAAAKEQHNGLRRGQGVIGDGTASGDVAVGESKMPAHLQRCGHREYAVWSRLGVSCQSAGHARVSDGVWA